MKPRGRLSQTVFVSSFALIVAYFILISRFGKVKKHLILSPTILYNRQGVALSSQFPPYEQFDEQAQANVCYFLQLSESSLALAPRLVARLWHPENLILVHVDAKVPDEVANPFIASFKKKQYTNVYLTPRQSITYAGMSMLLNILDAMEFALNLEQPWDYFIYLSGSDYPLVSAHNFRVILGQPRILNQQVSFVQICCGEQLWSFLRRYRLYKMYIDPQLGLPPGVIEQSDLVRTFKVNPMHSYFKGKFLHSSAFITAHRSMVLEAARGAYGRKLLPLLSHMKDPEEHFFAILAWNSNLNRTLAHKSGRLVFFNLNGVMSGQHPYWVDTRNETNGDFVFWPQINKASDFFVRKFKQPDSPLMDLIDIHISGAASNPNIKSVRHTLTEQRRFAMCLADIERHWNNNDLEVCPRRHYSE